MAAAVATSVGIALQMGTRVVRVVIPMPVCGSIRVGVKLLFFVLFRLFRLRNVRLFPVIVFDRLIHVTRSTHDWAELDVILLCDPSPAVAARLERRDLVK